jgi:ABC-2 type transport system ATP-binding protein
MEALKIEALTRLYRNGRGVRNVNLAVEHGEVFGFLGPNGAGKTTLIRTVMGFLHPSAGRVHVMGIDALGYSREVRRRVGYLPSDPALYDFLTGRQNIDFALAVRGVKDGNRVKELAARLDIDLGVRLRRLSRGNKQKVAIIAALAHDPDLLILDEPTSGLDPLVQGVFASLIREEQARGKSIFMSSHIMSEVEALCDRVAVIRDGEIVAVDRVENLKQQRVKHVACAFASAPAPAAASSAVAAGLQALQGVSAWQQEGPRVRFTYAGSMDALVEALAKQPLADLTLTDPPLEEVFRAYYEGRETR